MPNPRVIHRCNRCGDAGEHYTKSNGRINYPCVACTAKRDAARYEKLWESREAREDRRARQRSSRARLYAFRRLAAAAKTDPDPPSALAYRTRSALLPGRDRILTPPPPVSPVAAEAYRRGVARTRRAREAWPLRRSADPQVSPDTA